MPTPSCKSLPCKNKIGTNYRDRGIQAPFGPHAPPNHTQASKALTFLLFDSCPWTDGPDLYILLSFRVADILPEIFRLVYLCFPMAFLWFLGSGPEGADDLCFHTGEISPPPSPSPSPSPYPPPLSASRPKSQP